MKRIILPSGETIVFESPHYGEDKCLAVIKDIWASGTGNTNEIAKSELVKYLRDLANEVENVDITAY